MGEARRVKKFYEEKIIQEGFKKCIVCNGYGYGYKTDKEGYVETYNGKKLAFKCRNCNGDGQISWLRDIFYE